jgi:hypothetical protein
VSLRTERFITEKADVLLEGQHQEESAEPHDGPRRWTHNTNLETIHNRKRSRVSTGNIVSDYGLDDRAIGRSGFDPRRGQRIFSLTSVSIPALGPIQPPVQWVPGVLSPGVIARPGRDADHSPPYSAEVDNE